MRTGLRGFGSFRRELLESLRQKFGKRVFAYSEATSLPGFNREGFFILVYGDYLKKYRNGEKSLYKVADYENSHRGGSMGSISLTFIPCTGTALLAESKSAVTA